MQHKALLFATSLLIPSFSWALINTTPQLSMQGDNIRLTIPGYNPGGNVRFYIDMDNNPRTGSTNKDSGLKGADYYIENDILYAANGRTWKYVSGDLISFNNNYNNLVMEIDTTTFDKMANNAGLLNGAKKIDGFDGTVKMNVVTLDYKWNVLNTTGPTEYNILDIQVPAATKKLAPKSVPSKKAAKPVVAKKKVTPTNKKAKPTTSSKKVTETKKERARRLAIEERAALKAKLLARDKLKAQKKLAAKKKADARKKATAKSTAKKASAKRTSAKRTAAKRAAAKRTAAKRTAAKRAAAKRAAAKRAAAKRAAAKKTAAKKTAARKRLEARKKKQKLQASKKRKQKRS